MITTEDTREIGFIGEQLAARFLQQAGYTIVARNSQCGRFEIDLIAQDKEKCLIFTEVKTSVIKNNNGEIFNPILRITPGKLQTIRQAAQWYLAKIHKNLDVAWRIDGISVKIDRANQKARISHFKFIG